MVFLCPHNILADYLNYFGIRDVSLSTVFHQYMAAFPTEIDKAEETNSNIDCPSLIKDELKEFRIRKAQKTKILHHISQNTPDAA